MHNTIENHHWQYAQVYRRSLSGGSHSNPLVVQFLPIIQVVKVMYWEGGKKALVVLHYGSIKLPESCDILETALPITGNQIRKFVPLQTTPEN